MRSCCDDMNRLFNKIFCFIRIKYFKVGLMFLFEKGYLDTVTGILFSKYLAKTLNQFYYLYY